MKNTTREAIATVAGLSTFAATAVIGTPILLSGLAGIGLYAGIRFILTTDSVLPPNYEKIHQDLTDSLNSIVSESKGIKDKSIRTQVDQITTIVSEMLVRAAQSKSMLVSIADFLTTCLNSTRTILHKYNVLLDGEYETEAVAEIRAKIDNLLAVVLQSLDKEYQQMLKGDIMDLDAEIKLLQKTMSAQ